MVFDFTRRSRREPSLASAMLLSVVFIGLLLVGLDGWRTWQNRRFIIDADYTETGNLARSLAQHAQDTIQSADSMLVGLRERFEHDAWSADQTARFARLSQAWLEQFPTIHGLFVFDARGTMLMNSLALPSGAIDGADTDYFRYHRVNADRGVHVGGLLRCVSDCSRVLSISRRIDDAKGGFAGVVVAAISLDYLMRFYETFEKGDHGSIGLLSTAGIVLARFPGGVASIGTDSSRGHIFRDLLPHAAIASFDEVFPFDGIRRLGTYHTIAGYPLIVVVAHGVDDVLAAWRADALLHVGISVVVAAAVLVLGILFARQIRKRQASDEQVAALNNELAAQASTDSLTGIFNRRRFDETLAREWRRATRKSTPLSLLFIDVDHFKLYNDRYGHQSGDACLREIARAITRAARRPGDLVARYGGEEIAVLLADTVEDGAAEVAEQVRAAIEAVGMPHVDNPPHRVVTASIGVSTMTPNPDNTGPEDLIATADRALYEAKQKGRNRVARARKASAPPPCAPLPFPRQDVA